MAKSGVARDYDLERHSEVFRLKWVDDAVTQLLQKKMAAGH